MNNPPPKAVEVTDAAVFIRLNQLFRPEMSAQELYEAARGVWVVGPRRELAKYALVVYRGIVQEVYEIEGWHPAGSTPYETRPLRDVLHERRWEFVGHPAEEDVRSRYIGRSVAHYFKQGDANPIRYVNCG